MKTKNNDEFGLNENITRRDAPIAIGGEILPIPIAIRDGAGYVTIEKKI